MVGGLIGGLAYRYSHNMLELAANDTIARIGRETAGELNRLVVPGEFAVRLLAREPVASAISLAERMRHLPYLREVLNGFPAIASLYIAYGNGDFFLFRRLADAAERKLFEAPETAAYLVQSIERDNSPPRGIFVFLDENLTELRRDEPATYAQSFDARQRPWYQLAQAADNQIKTPFYVFFSSRQVGTTLAGKSATGSVVAADILLSTLGQTLTHHQVTPGTKVLLVNAQGESFAHEDIARLTRSNVPAGDVPALARLDELGDPVLGQVLARMRAINNDSAHQFKLEVDGETWRINLTPLTLKGTRPIYLLMAIPDQELFAAALTTMHHSGLLTISILLLALPLIWLIARNISGSIRALGREADAIRHFDFSSPINTRSLVQEVDELAGTMASMKRTIRRFLDISMAVAAEDDFDCLLPLLLDETMQAANARAGILYLADSGQLVPVLARRLQGEVGEALSAEFAALDENDRSTLLGLTLADARARGAALASEEIGRLALAPMLDLVGDDHAHAIAVPLQNRQHQTVGAMLLICPGALDPALVSFVGALSGSAAVSLEARELIKAQKALFEALIQLIAGAIDAKSAYTGGHCARVPELTKMLARAACEAKSGLCRDFSLDDNAWEALHIAAWLHDCGKITTPDYVVDKATKLETIHDRIHEIRTRFEVLKRDAEITCLKAIAAGANEAAAYARLTDELARLDDDYAFVATCNEGGEYMAPEKITRLHDIAARTWLRTLDDRIGISHEEMARKVALPAQTLPASETLLANKPEHRIERRAEERIAADNPWGFRMEAPELLYDRGELHNLAVARGTLTEEERYKINEHIVQTIIMLSRLPFPKTLREVPELAGGHHEKMDGTGYPRRLQRDEMSLLARMMAIADIFEALTAADRPYKKGKTLSEAIRIMAAMKKDGHIDPDIFDLFLRSGTYLDYARRYMQPEQIDAVDATAFLTSPADEQ